MKNIKLIKILLSTTALVLFTSLVGLNDVFSQQLTKIEQEYLGQYGDGIRSIGFEDGKLFLQRTGGPKIDLQKIEKDLYKLISSMSMMQLPNVKFVRDESRNIIGLNFIHADGSTDGLVNKDSGEPKKEVPITEEEKKEVVSNLAEVLEEMYLFPEIGEKYAKMLEENRKSGKYDLVLNKYELASTLTKDLNNLHKDGHLRIIDRDSYDTILKEEKKMTERIKEKKKAKLSDDQTFMHAKILEGNIALVKINSFPGTEETTKHAHSVMQSVKDCNAIIFDISRHRGGRIAEIDAIASYLYKEPTHLTSMVSRTEYNGEVRKQISEPNELSKIMSKIPVYILTSKATGSAGEHFALIFKSTGRGILVGKPTYGISHFSDWKILSDNFVGLIPFGHTFNPKTGKDWEGIGILPDIDTDPMESLDWVLNDLQKK